jgi:hypothetical protein|eukprot:g8428.t1
MADVPDVKRSRVESFGVEESARAVQNKLITSKVATWCCFIAALFISIHNGVRISEFASMRAGRTGHHGKWNMTKFQELPANDVYEHWKERHSVRGLHVLDEMAGIIGYSAIIPVISFIVPVLSRNVPGSLVYLALPAASLAAGLRIMEWSTNTGVRLGTDWMSTWSIMEPTASKSIQFIQVLEMMYLMQRFETMFLFTADYFFLGITFFVLSRAQIAQNAFSKKHAYLGYACFVLSFLNFIFDLARVASWGVFMIPSFLTRAIVGVILFPIWLVWLGCSLRSTPKSELSSLLFGTSGGNYNGM